MLTPWLLPPVPAPTPVMEIAPPADAARLPASSMRTPMFSAVPAPPVPTMVIVAAFAPVPVELTTPASKNPTPRL